MSTKYHLHQTWSESFVLLLISCLLISRTMSVRRENRCMRHYYVDTIKHPSKDCELKNVLLSKCEGFCPKSKTVPLVSFKPILRVPFKYKSTCCRDRLSIMRAVILRCKDEEKVYATYRSIIRCGCRHCRR